MNQLCSMDCNADSSLVDFMNLGADIVALTIWNGTELNKIGHLRQRERS